MNKISVIGVTGRMGRSIIRLLADEKDLCPGKGVGNDNSPALGMDVGMAVGIGTIGEPIMSSRKEAFSDAAGIIDFSTPKSTLETVKVAVELGKPLVIGTTGFSASQKEELTKASQKIPLLLAPNMSLGVNLLFKIVQFTAKALADKDFDIEVVEAHHRFKNDAPSGTAVKIAEILTKEKNLDMEKDIRHGRVGNTGNRASNEIGMHAIRGGDIVGDHTIYFTSLGERLELTHRAHSRDTFASGSISAIKFLLKSKPGLYNMFDVLGI